MAIGSNDLECFLEYGKIDLKWASIDINQRIQTHSEIVLWAGKAWPSVCVPLSFIIYGYAL